MSDAKIGTDTLHKLKVVSILGRPHRGATEDHEARRAILRVVIVAGRRECRFGNLGHRPVVLHLLTNPAVERVSAFDPGAASARGENLCHTDEIFKPNRPFIVELRGRKK